MKTLLKQKAHLLMVSLVLLSLSAKAQQSNVETIKKTVVVEVDTVVKGSKQTPVEAKSVNTSYNYDDKPVFYRGLLVVEGGLVYQDNLLPVLLVGEFGIARNFGLEARGWYGNSTKNGVKNEDGFLGLGLNYHFSGEDSKTPSKFDTYVGGGMYGKILDASGTAFYAQAGGRYFLFKDFGVFANLNLGLVGKRGTNLSFGLSYKIH